MAGSVETISKHACHGGVLGYYKHRSDATDCEMRFAVFEPPQLAKSRAPVLYYSRA
jgi:S-formylglutathione hydrolase